MNTYRVATTDVQEAVEMIVRRGAEADPDDVPGIVVALECILSMDGPPAADVIESAREAMREAWLDEAASRYLQERLASLTREQVRAVVGLVYPPASPGQDGWSSFLTDYAPAVAIRDGSGA